MISTKGNDGVSLFWNLKTIEGESQIPNRQQRNQGKEHKHEVHHFHHDLAETFTFHGQMN